MIVSVVPETASVSFSSSDTNVVTVNNIGLITGISRGTAVITITSGDKVATCEVTVP